MEERININKDKELFTLAIMRYTTENPNSRDDSLSLDWNLSPNYKLKSIIVADAIEKNILIEETELYKKHFAD